MRRLPLAVALVLSGCIDFKEITPPVTVPEAPAEFHAQLRVNDPLQPSERPTARAGAYVDARLLPGRDARGEPRPSRDDTLRISGVALAPDRVDPDGSRLYRGWIPLPARAAEGVLLVLSPPAVEGDTLPRVVHQPIPVRVGSDTLRVAAGAELRLAFAMPALPPGSRPLERGWMLTVGDGRTQLTITGTGVPPSPLVVPAGMIPASSSGWLPVRLQLSSHTGFGERRGDDYFVEVQFNASLGWTIWRGDGAPPE